MEPKLPKLQNLATHVTDCKGTKMDRLEKADKWGTHEFEMECWDDGGIFEGRRVESRSDCHVQGVPTYLCSMDLWQESPMDSWRGTNPSNAIQISQDHIPTAIQYNSLEPTIAHIWGASWKGCSWVCSENISIESAFSQVVKSKIAYATDTWTTPQMVYTFACTIGCFINDDWEIIEHVIDFKLLEDRENQGLYGSKPFTNGSLDKISFTFQITWDLIALTSISLQWNHHRQCISQWCGNCNSCTYSLGKVQDTSVTQFTHSLHLPHCQPCGPSHPYCTRRSR